jgi:hypothetical protein
VPNQRARCGSLAGPRALKGEENWLPFTWHVLPGMTASSAHWTLQTTHNTPKGCRTGLQSKASSKSTRHSGVPAIGRLNHAEGISNARLASLQIGIAAAPK